MTKRMLAPLFLMPCLALAAGLAQETMRPAQVYTVPEDNQPLFNQPVQYLGIKARLSKGQQLGIKAAKDQWRQVEGHGLEGWVLAVSERRFRGAPVSEDYLTSAANATIGAGLVTKGFGEAYGRGRGGDAVEVTTLAGELDRPRFAAADYDGFLQQGSLVFGVLEPVGGTSTESGPGHEPGQPGEGGGEPGQEGGGAEPQRGSSDLVDDLQGAAGRKRESMKLTQDPLYFSRNLSYEAERELGLAVGQRLAAGRLHDDEQLARYVSLIGAAVAEHCERADIPFRFIVLDDDEVNAFAAPGGFIFVTTGCIRACASEAELAGVLAHEVAHVARRHALRTMDKNRLQIAKRMKRAELDRLIDKYMGGMDPETASVLHQLTGLADEHYELCTRGWGREFELEADAYGMRYAAAVGWDYRGLLHFLDTLGESEKGGLGEAFRSHPPSAERIEKLEHLVREDGLQPTGNFVEERFREYSAGLR